MSMRTTTLSHAMAGCDVVYANIAGDMARQAESILAAMHDAGLSRLVFRLAGLRSDHAYP
ncbi:NAD(P)H-binding protein [Rhizobium leguminosarum]|uniref:NAD(P)H-binding protein n=1 Tax=Rhizobium leguminosarum TaxID=384 RepID=UPI0039657027